MARPSEREAIGLAAVVLGMSELERLREENKKLIASQQVMMANAEALGSPVWPDTGWPSRGAFKGVAWPREPVEAEDGTTLYPVTIIGVVLCSRPHRFTANETILAGECHNLVSSLEQVADGHAPYLLGDASSVLTSLDDITAGTEEVDDG